MIASRLTAAARAMALALAVAASARGARAQAVAHKAPPSLAGTWRGTSICTRESGPACHNEVVVYHLRTVEHPAAGRGEHLEWLANKIVNGAEEEMGTLACDYERRTAVAACPMRDWVWRFEVKADTLTGTLTDPKGTVWRNVRVVREGG